MLQHYVRWLDIPVEAVTPENIAGYIDFLMAKHLHPKTINCHLSCIRIFYDYVHDDEKINVINPVRQGVALRLPAPLPRYVKEEDLDTLFAIIHKHRTGHVYRDAALRPTGGGSSYSHTCCC